MSGRIIIYTAAKGNIDVDSDDETYYVLGDGKGGESFREEKGLANAIVELRSENELKRTISNRQGYFEFEELRPDNWVLIIGSDSLPEYHYLENDRFEVELLPGESEEVNARVLPRKRSIQIIGEPKTLVEEDQKQGE